MHGEKIPFAGGVMIVCGGRRTAKCDYCTRPHEALCDHPVIRRGKAHTCDRKLCVDHRKAVDKNVDLCPAHATQYELNGNRFALGDVALDPKEPAAETPVADPTDPRFFYQVFKPGAGWLSERGSNGKRAWIHERPKAQAFAGGAILDATLKTYKLKAYAAALFEMRRDA